MLRARLGGSDVATFNQQQVPWGGGYSNYDRDAFLYAHELGTLSLTSAVEQ